LEKYNKNSRSLLTHYYQISSDAVNACQKTLITQIALILHDTSWPFSKPYEYSYLLSWSISSA